MSRSASRSSSMRQRMPGRWTLTATTRPSCMTARWTCPSDAEASGVGSNSANALDAHVQLVANRLLDQLERVGRDLVLEPGERFGVLARQQVLARGEDLAQLDEGRSQPFEVIRQRLPLSGQLVGGRVRAVERVFEARAPDGVVASVLEDEPCDVAVALEPRRLQRDSHTDVTRCSR